MLLAPAIGGCLDWVPEEIRDPINQFINDFTPGPGTVFATELKEGAWNFDGRFTARVEHTAPLSISVVVEGENGDAVEQFSKADSAVQDTQSALWVNEITTDLEDGIWNVHLFVDGGARKTWTNVKVDATPPQITGLESVGKANGGRYLIGMTAQWDADATVALLNPADQVIASNLPHEVADLADGVHAFTVVVTAPSGLQQSRIVQVLAGNAKELPPGQNTAGVVARYTNEVEVWDISRPSEYLMPADAGAAQPGYLGSGHGITPNDPAVRKVVNEVVTPSMTSMDAALALYRWLYDNLEYDDDRLSSDTLMAPRDVILDTEDAMDRDRDRDGLVDSGSGNGVAGGVCRSLAGTYVSLLRAAGVPARLVTGYLAGTVNGFHAWVEFYAGPVGNQGGWVPVDVSPIDGRWEDDENGDGHADGISVLLQSFGVRLPHYLPLRALPAGAEVNGWSTALQISYSHPSGGNDPETGKDQNVPRFDYNKDLTIESEAPGFLCIHSDTWARLATHAQSSCNDGPYNAVYGTQQPFILQSTQVIDYGVDVTFAVDGTKATVGVAIPYKDEVAPVTVEHIVYVNHDGGPQFQPASEGKRIVTLSY